jgi:hypothetical protein
MVTTITAGAAEKKQIFLRDQRWMLFLLCVGAANPFQRARWLKTIGQRV